jgi:hypothetical protein
MTEATEAHRTLRNFIRTTHFDSAETSRSLAAHDGVPQLMRRASQENFASPRMTTTVRA